ncbi:MAG: hypothetical protein WAN12_07600 [Candidatus Acidiferrum sp.]
MNRKNMFRVLCSGRFCALAGLLALGLLLTPAGAKAGGCAAFYKAAAAPPIPFVSPQADDESREPATIVGLWHVIYTATYDNNFPPGGPYPTTPFPFLESLKTWHADGTEFENAFLPPAGGNICFGVWKDLGDHRVKLHHIGLMFNPDGSLSSIFTVDETDTVASDGKTYTGMFDFKLWPPSYDAVGVGTPIAEVKGTTAATRIAVD